MFTIKEKEVLEVLLKDYTTSNNIIFANKNYNNNETDSINYDEHIANNIIVPQALKSKDDKKSRKKEKGEVFTPVFIIEAMNGEIEKQIKDLNFDDYIKFKWMEITCGEGAFITTRYNAPDGTSIDIKDRVGFLDKKLDRISKEIHEKEKWIEYSEIALKSSYGFEYQGDSLYLARLNMLETIKESYFIKFKEELSVEKLKDYANIIIRNVFQADGLLGKIPFTDIEVYTYDWETDTSVKYNDITGGDIQTNTKKKTKTKKITSEKGE